MPIDRINVDKQIFYYSTTICQIQLFFVGTCFILAIYSKFLRAFTCVSVLSETECVHEVMSKTKMSGNLDRIMLL